MDNSPIAQISDSLEKIAHLPQEEQVELMKSLISSLKGDAAELISQNAGMKKILRDLECKIASSDNEWKNISYGDFVYQNKILQERLRRIMDPECNKNIQVGIIDEEWTNSKGSQTLGVKEAIVDYIRELRRLKWLQEQNCRTIETKCRSWDDVEDHMDSEPTDDGVLKIYSMLLLFGSLLMVSGFFYLFYLTQNSNVEVLSCTE